jgi:membrane protein DedA with SNARE-associated domain
MLLLSAGTLVSEDLACITAGLLAALGKLALPQGIMACALGIWLGDLGLYGLGAAARQGSGRWGWLARQNRSFDWHATSPALQADFAAVQPSSRH